MPYLLEHWKPVVGFEDYYLISNTGRVWSIRSNLQLAQWPDSWGYPSVSLWANGKNHPKRIHHLVMYAFRGKRPDDMTINHIDGWKQNPRTSNLEYITCGDNNRHAIAVGLRSPGRRPGTGQKLTPESVIEIRGLQGKSRPKQLAKQFNVSRNTIHRIWNREIWGSVA